MLISPVIFLLLLSSLWGGEKLYMNHCSSCHGDDRSGKTAPPLFPPFLDRYSDAELEKMVKEGLPATQMPSYRDLKDEDIKKIVSFMRKPAVVGWEEEDIRKALILNGKEGKPLKLQKIEDMIAVVERGKNRVWVMEGEEVLDDFEFRNVHGGVKFSMDGKMFFVPARDGWIGRYDIRDGRFYGKVRTCIYLRNIALSRDGRFLIVSCWLPQNITVLDSLTLKPLKVFSVEGKVSAIYELHDDRAVFTFRDKPLIGVLNTRSLKIDYIKIDEPVEDFFIDPSDRFIVGSSRNRKLLRVFDLDKGRMVFDHPIESMPHLFSASFWYHRGDFYFATPHIKRGYISVWKMYEWDFVKKIETGGEGFLIRTNPGTPYLWLDNGSDRVVLINKKGLSVETLTPTAGKKAIHTEFSGDGRIAYVSVYDKDGEIVLYDSSTLKEIKRIKADLPVGKYNFVNKSRWFEPAMLGREVYMEKCWGCHHPTREAFGPSFKQITEKRDEAFIRAYVADPSGAYSSAGYKSYMPKIGLKEEEVGFLLYFMRGSGINGIY
jgi:mono/diheme cytochrome c family protein